MGLDDDFAEISESQFRESQQNNTRFAPSSSHAQVEQNHSANSAHAQREREKREARKQRMRERVEKQRQEDARRFYEWKMSSEFRNQPHYNPTELPSPPQPTSAKHVSKRSVKVSVYQDWKQRCELAFQNYGAIESFPGPPSISHCLSSSCRGQERVLKACACQIEHALKVLRVDLKAERGKWHPDRFASCKEEKRDEFHMMAKEVFQVVQKMYMETRR